LRHYDLPGDDEVAPSAALSGRATVRWTGADIDGMIGEATLAFSPGAAANEEGALPVSGAAALSWKGRHGTIGSASLPTRGPPAPMTGRIDAATRPMGLDLAGDLASSDLEPLRRFVDRRFGPVPGSPTGRIAARFTIGGTTLLPDVRSSFDATGLTVALP